MDIRKKFTRKKFTKDELLFAHHEAAHAVTAEHLIPGSVEAVTIDGRVPGRHEEHPHGCSAMTAFTDYLTNLGDDVDVAAVILAGMCGESLVTKDGGLEGAKGDLWQVRQLCLSSRKRHRAEKKAKQIVLEFSQDVRRLSDALLERRMMSGHEVRELLRG